MPLTRTLEEDFDAVNNTNYKGSWTYIKAVVPIMKAAVKAADKVKNSYIVCTASVTSVVYTGMVCNLNDIAKAQFAESSPLGRLAQADELASCLMFPGCDVISYVTGTTLEATGGYRPSFVRF